MSEVGEALILNVGDEEAERRTLTRMLTGAGYGVIEATTGVEAVRLAGERKPDLIVLDLHRRDRAGFHVLQQIKADRSIAAIPALYISATHTEPGDVARGLEQGADGYLTEPVDPDVLLATVRALLRARRAEREAVQTREFAARLEHDLEQEHARAHLELERLYAEVQTQRTRLAAVVRQLPVGVVIVEAPSGRILLANDQMERIWRQPVAQVQTIEEYHHWRGFRPEGRPYTAEEWPINRAFRTGEVVIDEEIEVIRADGTRATLLVSASPIRDDSGRIIAGVVVDVDITERREAARALEQERLLLATIQESVPQAVAYLDRDLRFQRVNTAFAEMVALRPDQILGRTFVEVLPEDAPAIDALHRLLEEGQRVELSEVPHSSHRHPELGARRYDATFTPVIDARGKVEGLVISATDVTERAAQREQLLSAERARAELAENLSSEVTHRVKNNLAMLAGLLQMQINEQEDPSVASALHDTASRLVAFSRIHEQLQATQTGEVDLLDSMHRIAEAIREVFADKHVAIVVEGEHLSYPSRAATNLSMVANELITNAIKHGGPNAEGVLCIRIHLDAHEGNLHLQVWNSGNPVPPDLDLSRVTSMGLGLVYGLVVSQYHGTATLRPDQGGSLAEVTIAETALQ